MPASSYVNRDHAGGAVDTTITSDITGTSLSISIDDPTGWPTGGANGPFHVILSYDLAGKEKVEVQSRTGSTLTIADTGKRGIDGTSAQSHTAGAKIRHCVTAIDIQEANDHITNVGLDHHTQYLNTSRHAAIVHTAGMLGTDSVGSDEIAAGAVGSGELAAGAVTAGKIGVGGISAANQFATGVVDAAAIATDAVGSIEIAAGAVGSSELATGVVANGGSALATNQTLVYVQASDPGAVGSGKIWFDTTNQIVKVRNSGNTDWNSFGFDSVNQVYEEVNYFNNVTLGTGGTPSAYRAYTRIGDFIYVTGGFVLGTSGNVTGAIELQLPFTARALPTAQHFATGARCLDAGPSNVYSGTGQIDSSGTTMRNAVLTGAAAGWDNNTPFDWATGDRCWFFGGYWRA